MGLISRLLRPSHIASMLDEASRYAAIWPSSLRDLCGFGRYPEGGTDPTLSGGFGLGASDSVWQADWLHGAEPAVPPPAASPRRTLCPKKLPRR